MRTQDIVVRIQDAIEGKKKVARKVASAHGVSKRSRKIIRLFIKRFKDIFKVGPVELTDGTDARGLSIFLKKARPWGKACSK